ncbi:hypothetical protein BP422_19535 [Brevibacillus formosus]|uniref:Uncharacterized protein n=1 Tax=Brevibacillus formosus TaxID=54913 RepID=A0A220MK83_9BACL|nr:hypothetical protein BP422_19535 [Brevibacillus formosus]
MPGLNLQQSRLLLFRFLWIVIAALHPILYKNNIISMGNNATISVFRMDSNGINYSGYTLENQSTMIISAFINDYQL